MRSGTLQGTAPIAEREGRGRVVRWGMAIIVVVALVAWSAWRAWSEPGLPTTGEGMSAEPGSGLTTNPSVSSYGVMVGVDVSFDQDRVITSAGVDDAGTLASVEMYPHDGTDNNAGYPLPLAVPDGIEVGVEARLYPDCSAPPGGAPALVIESEREGEPVTNSVAASTMPDWRDALAQWCSLGMQVNVAQWTSRPNGNVSVTFTLINPGPGAVTVVSPSAGRGAARWKPARIRVGPASEAELIVRGVGVAELPSPDLLADGQPVRPCQSVEDDDELVGVQLC